MGSKLSPLLANVFMSDFEVELQKEKLFPRVWRRYVDDIFAVVKERYLSQVLDLLNAQHESIKFTLEKEVDGKLPFLDLMISKTEENRLKYAIYRKPTSTDREFVDKILRKHERKKHRRNATTLKPEKEEVKRISLPFYPKISNPIHATLEHHGYQVVYKSSNTLKDLLCNLKDKVPADEKSGIYQIPCQNCPAVYIGQTRRKFKIRLREHKHAVENKRTNESSVAVHTTHLDHAADWENAKLVKNVRKSTQLNAWESMYIATANRPLMNEDDAPIQSPLFNLTKLRIQ
ncbi:uncharacterized protein LOC134286935 [Aedes albopictus]|uniref:Reverse transcriptase domain-containing protein n=1 Tax=Aedes albopictus TaxID=7160 RepID=A0ABM1ZNY0_AEDAL